MDATNYFNSLAERSRKSFARWASFVVILITGMLIFPHTARALPSYAVQTDQPCTACHVGAFGPRLKQQGRDFKLYGYTANDTRKHDLPFSFSVEGSFTHTAANQPGNSALGYSANNNFALEGIFAYYTGTIFGKVGTFIEYDYDAVTKSFAWQDFDIRYAQEARPLGIDSVLGLTINNAPTEADLWDSSPQWQFPYAASGLVPAPASSTLIDQMPSTVLGIGGYGLFGDTLYLESDVYGGLQNGILRVLGTSRIGGNSTLSGPAVYWRAVLQHEFDAGAHYLAAGTYGLHAAIFPDAVQLDGHDTYDDIAFDATYQWIFQPEASTSDMISAHLLYIHENANLSASSILVETRPSDSLASLRADLVYSFASILAPQVQYFRTTGSRDIAKWMTPNGDPDSAGWVAELDYLPWGKPDSPWNWLNLRLALQYTAYSRFDGSAVGASGYDTLLLSAKLAAAPD